MVRAECMDMTELFGWTGSSALALYWVSHMRGQESSIHLMASVKRFLELQLLEVTDFVIPC
jgi:hypothetical protein